jgi:hypothetical protein
MEMMAQQDPDDVRERYFWDLVLRTSVIVLVIGAVAIGSLLVTAGVSGQAWIVFSVIGLVAGASIMLAVTASPRIRSVAGAIMGGITLPLLAIHLADIGARSTAELSAYSVGIHTFLASALAAALSGVLVRGVWRNRPPRPTRVADGAVRAASVEGAEP